MPRLPLAALALIAVAAFAATACSSASGPGWTYAPAPSVTPAASGSGSPSAAPSGSAAPSAAPSAASSAAPSAPPSAAPSGGTATLTVTAPDGAATTGFDPKALEGPANSPFTVVFDNQDTTTSPHNWVLKDSTGATVDIGDTAFFSGPAKKDYQVPALAPGDYPFLCDVHPVAMTGTLTVK